MTRATLMLVLMGFAARAQELSAPPAPLQVHVPDSVLPKTPVEREVPDFTPAFTSRVSFFSTDERAQFDIDLGAEHARCRAPCSVKTNAGDTNITFTRNGHLYSDRYEVRPGENYLMILPYSPGLVAAGSTLTSLSLIAAISAVVLLSVFPGGVVLWLLSMVLPAAVFGVPGVIFLLSGAQTPTATFMAIRAPLQLQGH